MANITQNWIHSAVDKQKFNFVLGVNALNVNEQTLDNLCGDLNKGYLPLNPIGQTVEGVSYPL